MYEIANKIARTPTSAIVMHGNGLILEWRDGSRALRYQSTGITFLWMGV